MIIVGLTGGIGSGKTTVAQFFEELGVPVYNSDKAAKKLMKSSKKVRKAIIELLGDEAYKNRKLNKKHISKAIFNDKNMLEKLNSIVHPAVRKHFLKWTKKQNSEYVIQETALIFENSMQDFYDKIILVVAPEELRIQRVMKRSAISRVDLMARLKNQWTDEKKRPFSDYVIDNIDLPKTKIKVADLNDLILDFC